MLYRLTVPFIIFLPGLYLKFSLKLGGLIGVTDGSTDGTMEGSGDDFLIGEDFMFDGLLVVAFESFAVGEDEMCRVGAALCNAILLFVGAIEKIGGDLFEMVGATVGDCTTFVGDTVGSAFSVGAFFVGSKVGEILGDLAGALVGLVVKIAVGAAVGFLFPLFIEIALSSLSINI